MNRTLQIIAITLWVASLALPTVPDRVHGGNNLGVELLFKGILSSLYIPFSLFFPGHIVSVYSNFFLIREVALFFTPARSENNLPSLKLLAIALLVNVYMGYVSVHKSSEPEMLAGILKLPGYYFWVSSYFFLLLARVIGSRNVKNIN